MKSPLKLLSLFLCLILLCATVAGCSGAKNDFTSEDVINRSASQQRWLKSPESRLILNPSAVTGEDTRNLAIDPIAIGVTDESGNTVATYDDLLFILEGACANGQGNIVENTVDWSAAKGVSKYNPVVEGSSIEFTTTDAVTNTNYVDLRLSNSYTVDFTDPDLNLRITIEKAETSIQFLPVIQSSSNIQTVLANYTEPGTYYLNFKEIAEANSVTVFEGGNRFSIVFRISGPGTVRVGDISFVRFAKGGSEGSGTQQTEWAPYYMKTTVGYPNNSSLETVDFFYGANTVSRIVTPVLSGSYIFAGKIYGNLTFDAKNNAFLMETENGRIAVFPRRKGTVSYYATYEDLLSGENAMETPEGAAYWGLAVNDFNPDENTDMSFRAAVSASDTLSFDELIAEGTEAITVTKSKRAFEALPEYWDAYIAENDVSAYITVLPQ